jgi:uncharacterized protein
MTCNFGCYYCYETHLSKSRINSETIGRINKLISCLTINKDIKYFSLAFFGGEPLLIFQKRCRTNNRSLHT